MEATFSYYVFRKTTNQAIFHSFNAIVILVCSLKVETLLFLISTTFFQALPVRNSVVLTGCCYSLKFFIQLRPFSLLVELSVFLVCTKLTRWALFYPSPHMKNIASPIFCFSINLIVNWSIPFRIIIFSPNHYQISIKMLTLSN